MTDTDNPGKERLVKGFEKALNSHGYAFQYSVLKEVARLAYEVRSALWIPKVPEFPVEVQRYDTRIDFILKHAHRPFYLVAECKRANPSLASWCFAKMDITPPIEHSQHVTVEGIKLDIARRPVTYTQHLTHTNDVFHVAVEVKTGDQGDSKGPGRGAIEDAAAQVCRGVSGLVDFLSGSPGNFEDARPFLLPVIFTTAKIWTSSVQLGSASLTDGTLTLSDSDVEEKPWIFYQYHQSPGLRHSVMPHDPATSLETTLYGEFVRNIAVVSPSGIADFLERSSKWLG
jgi:hypothetical protein